MKKQLLSILALVWILNSALAQSWSLTGNTGTNPASNFVGTIDAQKLIFRTGNVNRMSIGINQEVITIGNLDPDVSPYGGRLQIKGTNETSLDLIRATNNPGTGWENQIRFYNYSNLRHLITDDYSTGKLVIQTNVDPASGSVDVLDIRGRVQINLGGGPITIPTPSGYGLYVADGILTEKVKVAIKTTADWADYVFHKDHKLLSFAELERFIKQNSHLPGIPSAQEMVTEGNDLAKTDVKLLEKIEELTLYVLQLNREKKDLVEKVNELTEKLNKVVAVEILQKQLADLKNEIEQLKK